MNKKFICSLHKTASIWKTGNSKSTGKPYAFWSCSQPPVNGEYCKAVQVEDSNNSLSAQASAQAFEASLKDKESTSVDDWMPIKQQETNAMLSMANLKAKEYAIEAAGRVVAALFRWGDFVISKISFFLTLDYA